MATKALNVSLSITSDARVNGVFEIDANPNDVLSFDDAGVTGSSVSVATGSPSVIVAALADAYYVYIKNTDTANFIDLKNVAHNVWGILHPGEFAFFCVNPSDGFEVQANTAECVVEYVTFKKA